MDGGWALSCDLSKEGNGLTQNSAKLQVYPWSESSFKCIYKEQ